MASFAGDRRRWYRVMGHGIKTIKSVPLKLQGEYPETLKFEGVVLPFDGFNAMNKERIAAGEEPYKNPRNTASGSLKLQGSVRSLNDLWIVFCTVLLACWVKSQFDRLKKAVLGALKCLTRPNVLLLMRYWSCVLGRCHDLPYEIDGIVKSRRATTSRIELYRKHHAGPRQI